MKTCSPPCPYLPLTTHLVPAKWKGIFLPPKIKVCSDPVESVLHHLSWQLKHCLHLISSGSRSFQIYPFPFFWTITALIKSFLSALSFPAELAMTLSSPSQCVFLATSYPFSPPSNFSQPLAQHFWLHSLSDKRHLLLSDWTFLSSFSLLSFLCSLTH